MLDVLSFEVLALLCLVAGLAGFVDAIAGGGGLLTIPALIWAGLPPVQALATNKLQGTFGTLSSSITFFRMGRIQLREISLAVVLTFIGSATGTVLVQYLPAGFLVNMIPWLLVLVAIYTVFSPRMGDEDRHQRIGRASFAFVVGFSVGFYDGFFGPGTGSFFGIAFVALLGYNLTRATAHAKVLNLTSNAASLLFFALGGKVLWSVGLVMGAGQMLGAWLGSHMVIRNGSRIVRPILFIVSVAMAIKVYVSS
ncbi:MAG: TSUP family transporter [Gammaproteobacteria bacterium]|nr:TSUP family transporter [Gammaproteobacteria bacterium]